MSVMASIPNPYVGEECGRLTWIWLWGRTPEAWTWRRQNPDEGGGGHVGWAPATRGPPHDIEGACLLWEPYNTKKIESCIIIEILTWIQNTSLIYLCVVDVWGRWIAWCSGTRKQWWRTIQSVPLVQEVISYVVKQYCYKIGKIAYLKVVPCIIKMIRCWLCIGFCIISLWRGNVSSFWSSRLWQDQLDELVEEECRCWA
jgi:hypothetical protein